MVDETKTAYDGFKYYTPNEHEEFEETVKDALRLHDKLLKIGFKEIAEDALKIHDNLLGIKERKAKPDLMQTSVFLRDQTGHIYGKIGIESNISKNEISEYEPVRDKLSKEDIQTDIENYRLFLQNIKGSIGLWLDENIIPIFIDGSVKEITGYNKEDFKSMKLKWIELIIPEDRPLFLEHLEWVKSNPNIYAEIEYRLKRKDGEVRWVREIIHVLPEKQKYGSIFQSFIRDITEWKQAEEQRMKFEEAHKKEIHHRIKNNLQVISSVLDLQAENLAGKNSCDPSQVSAAFKESRDRVASIAFIHEELYRSTGTDSIDFSAYLKKLICYLFDAYKGITGNISLKLNLEEVHLRMDTAVPLGSIATELISNALKHAFPYGSKGKISIFLCNKENYKKYLEKSGDFRKDLECMNAKDLQFVLVIKNNGIDFPKEIDFKNTDTLGLQLVNVLVDQVDGCIELKRDNGTEFVIWFNNIEE